MPAWIHARANHIRAKNPGMPKSQAFAIATQQAYASGKAPKGYGTKKGHQEAKEKYDSPKSKYKKTADPKTKSAMWSGFAAELEKIAAGFTPGSPVGTSNVQSLVRKQTSSLTSKPKPVSKSNQEPAAPTPVLDHLGSSRTIQPPPATMSGGI